ncbi:uncharacterized protein CC84DRAFT_1191786 [Paraphaeosphaeria sporulosa]|uniref:Uncharacterized protein n=1 Tax=Paraphaeosphaeria sporulosa TaxID=1460663 RepID=A0A177BVD0_9PLEO|nr:uncharacterized protein CC84DRAFT_1191786 [Paraphaeosphaeria sporulosa]OAF98497.1 hypothetical protein CC84DRAFT_1191786 [Paraphaeosphaeria sporulosa]
MLLGVSKRRGYEKALAWGNVQKWAKIIIQDGARNEVNPWLKRIGWMPYLVGMERPDLLASEAMDGLVRFSQSSIIHHIGIFVRLEVICTKKHQTYPKYQFTKRQREAWEAFVKEARGVVGGEEEDKEQPGATLDNKMTDDADSIVGEMEEAPVVGVGNMGELETLLSIKKACLAFYITLLN